MIHNRSLTTLIFCATLLLTNRWLTYSEGIDILKASDTRSYMTIAQAAPHFPALAPDALLPTNHAVRFVVPYLVGVCSHAIGIPCEQGFLAATLCFFSLIVWTTHRILQHLQLTDSQYMLAMALLIFNPYMFRYYLAVPAMVNDLVFVAGLGYILLGLVQGSQQGGFSTVVVGSLIAVLGRQNMLVILPALAVWLIRGTQWQSDTLTKPLLRSTLLIASVIALYVVLERSIVSFSVRGMESGALTGFIRWIIEPSEHNKVLVLAEYSLRLIICPLMLIAFLIAITLHLRLQGLPLQIIASQTPKEFWFSLLIAASLFGFAFLGGPSLFMTGVTRYVSHALPAVLVGFSIALRHYHLFTHASPSSLFGLGTLIALGSFHHMTTFSGTNSDKASYFAFIYCILAIFAGVFAFRALRSVPEL
ncbi:MAG: hypothetical protein RML40_03490 [Bacteroidota bacterium]|nr:hypothetical protein [Candidatus Kapabacteria bacterium]MDW8219574.1 hypothetical protein [Bacteroidota bacterium]